MITRAHMRRQLRATGGITNARQGYGIGSWVKERVRKIIPNELADIAVKAAPFVAPFYPGAAAAMRGIGRFDQRGSMSDAMKQAALTYGFGKGARYLGGVDPSLMPGQGTTGFDYSMDKFGKGPIGRLFQGGDAKEKYIQKINESTKTGGEKGLDIVREGVKTIEAKVPLLKKLPSMVKQQLLVGGITAGASALYDFLVDKEPPQQDNETPEQYMERRRQSVGRQMRTYMDSYFKFDPEYSALDDAGKDAFVAKYNMNQGGRVGYQAGGISEGTAYGGGISMANTLAQNRAINNARRASNQSIMQQARQRLTSQGLNRNQPTGLDRINVTNMANRIQHENLDQATGGARGVAALVTGTPTQDDISAAIAANQRPAAVLPQRPADLPPTLLDLNKPRSGMPSIQDLDRNRNEWLAQQSSKYAQAGRGPNGGIMIDGKEYFSEQEAIDDMGIERYTQLMSKGGRVGLHGGGAGIEGLEDRLQTGAPSIIYEGDMRPNRRAQGGRIGYRFGLGPVAQGLPGIPRMAPDGLEYDMSQNGGFQPLGAQEGKDDVKANLAKNEFVFTADAVRAAGNGDIELGAQKMYDTMKKLESRVA